MNARLTHVPLPVTDQDRALEYYTKQVGFQKRADIKGPTGARWLTVAPEGSDAEFALLQAKQQVQLDATYAKAGTTGLQFTLSTTDCRGDVEAMRSRGVFFDVPGFEKVQRSPWGTTAYFRDPDGNQFAMLQQSWIGRKMAAAMAPKKRK